MQDFLRTCEQAARDGGRVLRQWQGRVTAREKGPADLVTQADLASQEAIRRTVLAAFPSHAFLGEEQDEDASVGRRGTSRTPAADGYRWVVDPLDGTTNYVHQYPYYCVSVALLKGQKLQVGCIYDPSRDECFTAATGSGAWCNGRPLTTAPTKSLDQALVASSFAARVEPESAEVAEFLKVLYRSQSIRRLGSAALNLAYLAAGRLDVFWSTSVKLWDVAAGVLMVQEAGGQVSSRDGLPWNADHPSLLAASTVELHAELRGLLAE